LSRCYTVNRVHDFLLTLDFSQFKDTLFENTLLYYPNFDILKNVCKKSKLNFIQVYFNSKGEYPNSKDPSDVKYVYADLDQSYDNVSEATSYENYISFTKLVKKSNRYLVNHCVDLGLPLNKESETRKTRCFTYYYGYTGNSPVQSKYVMHYFKGILINPKEMDDIDIESEAGEISSYNGDSCDEMGSISGGSIDSDSDGYWWIKNNTMF
jgi:hypothetical protein